jgi:hypothetical protein
MGDQRGKQLGAYKVEQDLAKAHAAFSFVTFG